MGHFSHCRKRRHFMFENRIVTFYPGVIKGKSRQRGFEDSAKRVGI
jgi:hypothetical protein